MSPQSVRALSRSIGLFSIVQMCIALALVGSRCVDVVRGPSDAFGVPVGIAVGLVLYYAIAAGELPKPITASRLSIAALAALLAGVSIAEEILWRGFALQTITRSAGPVLALIATTLGFAASHAATQGWSGIRYHLVTGLAMGLTCMLTGSLLSAIATHLSYNLMFVRRIALQGSIV